MTRDEVLRTLAAHRGELRKRFAVKSLAVFGSVVRNEATEASDVDVLVEFDRPVGYFHVFHTQEYLEDILGGAKVDLVQRRAVVEELRERIYSEAVDVPG